MAFAVAFGYLNLQNSARILAIQQESDLCGERILDARSNSTQNSVWQTPFNMRIISFSAEVAELADALVWGASEQQCS